MMGRQYRRLFAERVAVKFFVMGMLYVGTSLAESNLPALAESNLPPPTTGDLIGRPSRPSENKYTYYLSASQKFLSSRNRYAPNNSKYTSSVKNISFDKKQSKKWEWGANYYYSDQKYTSFPDNSIERERSHELDPYLTYYLDRKAYWSAWVGRSISSVKIRSGESSSAALGKTRSGSEMGGIEFNIWENYGHWKPSLDATLYYEDTKTKQYTLSNGTFNSKQRESFLQGQCVGRLDLNKFEAFQPYVKAGYQNVLHRSKQYLIQNWNGWLVGAGGSFYGAKKWNASVGYEYNKMPTGDCQSLFMISLAMNF